MASHCAYSAFSFSPTRDMFFNNPISKSSTRRPFLLSSITNATASYNTLVSEAVRLLGPPARFEASKLKVVPMEDQINKYASILPRTYILSHCDFTANLTLTVSNVINLDQLRGWYKKDDVVAEWKKVKDEMCLHVHCFVSGPNLFLDLAAEFRYHIFSKEMPLVLKAIQYGDAVLFSEHPELLDSIVRVYFHSSSEKYNRMECWGPLKEATEEMESGRKVPSPFASPHFTRSGLAADKMEKKCSFPPIRGEIKRKMFILVYRKIKQACNGVVFGHLLS